MKSLVAFLIHSQLLHVMFQTDNGVHAEFKETQSAVDKRLVLNDRHRNDTSKVVCLGEDSFVQKGRCITLFSEKLTFYDAELKCEELDSEIISYENILATNRSFNEEEEVLYWNAFLLYERTFITNDPTPARHSDYYVFKPGNNDYCLVTSTRRKTSYVSCLSRYPFACVSLYSNVLSMKVNEGVVLSDNHLYITNGSLKIECLVNAVNNTMSVYITKNDTEIARADNQSQVAYYVPVIKCDNAGNYKCKAEFPESGINMESPFSISMPCPLSLTLSVNGEAINNTKHLRVPIGTAINLKCSVENPEDTYVLFISNGTDYLVSRSVKDVAHNLTIKDCKDSATYTCHYASQNGRLRADVELDVVVDNCSIHLISFNYGIAYEDYFNDRSMGYYFLTENKLVKRRYKYLVCNAETYSRPTKLAIRAYDGSILTSKQNVSRIELHLFDAACDNNGKVTCELTDYFSKQTYTMEKHIFREGCPPKFCHEEVHWKHVEATLYKNVTVSFCFMIDDTGLNVSQRTVFKNAESIALNDTMKFTSEIIASNETEVKKQFTFTIVGIEENDFGQYSINLQTGEGNSITFSFTLVVDQNT